MYLQTTNVVSTALLGCLLLPKLRETALELETYTHFTYTASELYEEAKFKERKAPPGQIFATLNSEEKSNMRDRYNTSKLLGVFFIKQLAAMAPVDSNRVIANCVAPGCVPSSSLLAVPMIQLITYSFCHSELTREFDNCAVRIAKTAVCRPTEVGARTLVYGASIGPESHGQYVPDCKITPTAGLTKGEKGAELQQRVWEELRDKLEASHAGSTSLV